jgi:hypothetical protein
MCQFINQICPSIFSSLSGSYTCGNLSGSYACDIYLSIFVRLLRLRHLPFHFCPVLIPAAICPALTSATFIFPVLFGSYTCDNLSGSYTYGNLSGSYACDVYHSSFVWFLHLRHLSSQFFRFLYLRKFVRLLRLRCLSFQFCPVLTPAAMFPLFGSHASGNVSFVRPPSKQQSIPGLAPKPAAISQYSSKQRRMSLLISPI